ncbi:mitochondrial glycerol dehydrogenase Gld1 [Schizosaccharomyces osmophilus]|uniref:Mitochondrial glycerol dehydrogenase Gld1 n=1 Tax=Schizosaccharomyces osmophilus TaxID=2545709 RepID=A0AAE9WEC6_9SCHI|nr:mitochondrial glycerol dehydrogenase Gld1 [Schizosaccharomyces osmophilus]WBW73686.1 mitochondrial glycerol dehydrogenase Gld1 [Schizosaccharomyces osmophilus]
MLSMHRQSLAKGLPKYLPCRLAHLAPIQGSLCSPASWGKRFYSPLESERPKEMGWEKELTTDRIFTSPQKYAQGRNIFGRSFTYVKSWATDSAVVLADPNIWKICAPTIVNSLESNGMKVTKLIFGGESSLKEIHRLQAECPSDSQIVIGVGGGKTIDTAKYLANEMRVPCIIAPTTASSDAATASLSVIYTSEGEFQKYSFYPTNPNFIMVDTDVIVKAPVRFLISGIGDALSTYVETESVLRSHSLSFAGGVPTVAGAAIARACKETIEKFAVAGILSNLRGVCTEAFENTVEANTLLSGLGFENGNLAAAHAIHNGLTTAHGNIHRLMHGEKVAYGTLAQLILENWPLEDYYKMVAFMSKCHLPVTLEELGIPFVTDEELLMIGRATLRPDESIHNMSKKFTPQDIADAIKAVDSYSKKWREENNWTESFELPASRHHPHVSDIHP